MEAQLRPGVIARADPSSVPAERSVTDPSGATSCRVTTNMVCGRLDFARSVTPTGPESRVASARGVVSYARSPDCGAVNSLTPEHCAYRSRASPAVHCTIARWQARDTGL